MCTTTGPSSCSGQYPCVTTILLKRWRHVSLSKSARRIPKPSPFLQQAGSDAQAGSFTCCPLERRRILPMAQNDNLSRGQLLPPADPAPPAPVDLTMAQRAELYFELCDLCEQLLLPGLRHKIV